MVRYACPASHRYLLIFLLSDGKEARVVAKEAKLIVQQTANNVDEIKCSSSPNRSRCSRLNLLTGNQLKQLLRAWLSPADPSTNHNIARKAQHKGTAVLFFQDSVFIEWKSTGSLLWIHGKRAFLSAFFGLAPSDRLRFSQRALGKVLSGLLFLASFISGLILLQFLRYSRHYGCLRSWISHHGLLLLRFQGSQQAKLSRPAAFSRIPAFYSL